ncbi:hypothetical protein [Paenibacillus naphthalenovorans]|uniref:hypothetical protein n=1 Tax=Paenibacillus naphthalenovorans TaxID=162209 RepID=UPI003D284EFB
MATTTPNLGLKKPAQSDFYNVEDSNGNSDLIDGFKGEFDKEVVDSRARQIENIGYGVQTGLDVIASATPDMNVHVQTGVIYMPDGQRFQFDVVTIIAVSAANGTNPRKDIVFVSSAGAITYLAGTPAAAPAEPALPAGAFKLCVIDVPATDTAIEQAQITDSRGTIKKTLSEHLAETTHIGKNKQVKVYSTASQSIPSGAYTTLVFNTEYYDDAEQHDNAVNNSRLTCKEIGKYLIHSEVLFASNATGYRGVRLRINESIIDGQFIVGAVNGNQTSITFSTIRQLNMSEYVEVQVIQNTGGSLDVLGAGSTKFGMVRVG